MHPNDLKRSFISLFWTLFAGYLVALAASVVLILFVNHVEKSHTAHLLAVSLQNEIVTGDFRSAIVALNQSVPSEFSSISYFDLNGNSVFGVPTGSFETLRSATALTDRASEPISLGAGGVPVGYLVFHFPRTGGVSIAVGFWLGVLFVSIPFIKRARNRMLRQYQRDIEIQQSTALGHLAGQVAHDIRSPLAALKMASRELDLLPEETRVLISSAMNRIGDIANQLLQKNRESGSALKKSSDGVRVADNSSKSPLSELLLPALLDSIVSEKRLEYRSYGGLEIAEDFGTESYGLFVRADSVELKRMISNLVNNAAEALNFNGKILLQLQATAEFVELQVRDNGKGIPPTILTKLGQRGETHGKPDGRGLGLFHAKTCAEEWGGSLSIASEVGKGTCLSLKVPRLRVPDWFVERLKVRENAPVIVLDDDVSVHRLWAGRFEALGLRRRGIEILHFTTPESLLIWLDKRGPDGALSFLVDYQLSGSLRNGLDFIEESGIEKCSVLVTSRYEDERIIERCKKLGVRLIPKVTAGLVPIEPITAP